jgi:hypothetical protein
LAHRIFFRRKKQVEVPEALILKKIFLLKSIAGEALEATEGIMEIEVIKETEGFRAHRDQLDLKER